MSSPRFNFSAVTFAIFPITTLAVFIASCSAPSPSIKDSDKASLNASVGDSSAFTPDPVVRQTPQAPPDSRADQTIAIDGEGLRLSDVKTGSGHLLRFGLARNAVLATLPYRGEIETGRLEECGAGPLDYAGWRDGLKLYFQDGKFVGWAADQRSNARTDYPKIATATGIGIGSSRAEMEKAYAVKLFESSLGTEFEAGNLFGLLDGPGTNAKITNFWAGISCNMR